MNRETLERQKAISAKRVAQNNVTFTRQAAEAANDQLDIQREQLNILNKIHFWVKFWSIVGIVSFSISVLAGLIVLLDTL